MKIFSKQLVPQQIFLAIIWTTLVYAFLMALIRTNYTALFVITLTIFFTFIPTLLHRQYNIKLPQGIALFGVFFAYATVFLGEYHGFYEIFWWWDILLHGSSAMVFGLVGIGVLRMMQSAQTISAGAGVMSIFGFTFALAIGAMWEIVEFLLDQFLGLSMQDNLTDTMSDLMMDAGGAFIVVALGYLHWKYHKENFIGTLIENFIIRSQR